MVEKLLGIIIAASLPFLFTLQGDFVFDDSEAVVQNKDVSSESWTQPFYNDFWGTDIRKESSHKSYRPLTILSFRLNYILNNRNLSATLFKGTNLICHIGNCLLIWKTYEIILKDFGTNTPKLWYMDVSFLASLLFAVHPVHVEAVSGIVGRADLLASITFFLSFMCYRRAMDASETERTREYAYLYTVFSVIMAGVSMLFKENGITVGGFCICYEAIIWLQQKYSNRPKLKKPIYKSTHTSLHSIRICFYILSIIILLYGRWIVMGAAKPVFKPIDNPAAFSDDFLTKVLSYNYIYFLNFLLMIWPQWLCYDWSMGCVPLLHSFLDYRVVFVLLLHIYAMLLLRTVYVRRKVELGGLILVSGLLIAIPFLPVANILYPVGFVVAERILYIPSAGYCLLVTLGLQSIRGFWKGKLVKCKTYAFFMLLGLYGVRSWHRSMDWQNEYQLFGKGLSVCPLNAKVRYNVAKVMTNDLAIMEYRLAIRLHPKYYQAMNNLANLLRSRKKYEEAETLLVNAISLKNDFAAAWMNLGIVLANTRRYEEARRAYETALSHRSQYADCYFNLGNMYLELDKIDEALDNWQQAINFNAVHVQAWTNILTLLDSSGRLDNALQMIPQVLRTMPDAASINFVVASIYGKLERYQEAESLYVKSIQLLGNKAQAVHYSNLGVLYHRWGKYDKAENMYRQALKIDRRFKSAIDNLEKIKRLKAQKSQHTVV